MISAISYCERDAEAAFRLQRHRGRAILILPRCLTEREKEREREREREGESFTIHHVGNSRLFIVDALNAGIQVTKRYPSLPRPFSLSPTALLQTESIMARACSRPRPYPGCGKQ